MNSCVHLPTTQAFVHEPPPALATRSVQIWVIGAGGTGSALLPRLMQLHQTLLRLGHPGGLSVSVMDGDTVSEANIGRQGFYPQDVGQNKALLSINRLNLCWGTQWQAIPQFLQEADWLVGDIVIGCVDTRAARAHIRQATRAQYYLDSGNGAKGGQVVLGETRQASGQVRLPTALDLFPELGDASLDKTMDTTPSCSVREAIHKQALFVNQMMALEMANLLSMLLIDRKLTYHGAFLDIGSGCKTPIGCDPRVWRNLGWSGDAEPERAAQK